MFKNICILLIYIICLLYNHNTIRHMNTPQQVNEQPVKRLESSGLGSLTDTDLLSIVIGGNRPAPESISQASVILSSLDYDYSKFNKLNMYELVKLGLTKNQAVKLIAANELYRRTRTNTEDLRKSISGSNDVYNLMNPVIGHLQHEEVWAIYLNRSNKVIDKVKISQGGISGSIIDNRIILRKSIERSASSIIISHNHPSGNKEPSDSDKTITEKIKVAAQLIDTTVLDHIIITEHSYYSFADNGII